MKELKVRLLMAWEASLGLMGRKSPQAVFFTTRWGIHTFFVRFPIDIVILDEHNTVCLLKRALLPNRVFVWNPKYYRVIELPGGTIEKIKLKIGEKITLTFL